jgi:general secretion pathway protein G
MSRTAPVSSVGRQSRESGSDILLTAEAKEDAEVLVKKSRAFYLVPTIFLIVGVCLYLWLARNDEIIDGGSCKADLRVLNDAFLFYRKDTGVWPERVRDLLECPDNLEGWRGPYLRTPANDPWRREYLLFKNEWGMRIATFGRDGLPGGQGEDKDFIWDVTRQKFVE